MKRSSLKEVRCAALGFLLAVALLYYINPSTKRVDETLCGPTVMIMRAMGSMGFGYVANFEDHGHEVYALYVNDSTGDWRIVAAQDGPRIRACVLPGGTEWKWWWK